MRSQAEVLDAGQPDARADNARRGAELARAERPLSEVLRALAGGALDAAALDALCDGIHGYLGAQRERRERWLGHFAHELRNPLSSLSSALWLLGEDGSRVAASQVVALADRAIARMDAAVTQLLALEQAAENGDPPMSAGVTAPASAGGAG